MPTESNSKLEGNLRGHILLTSSPVPGQDRRILALYEEWPARLRIGGQPFTGTQAAFLIASTRALHGICEILRPSDTSQPEGWGQDLFMTVLVNIRMEFDPEITVGEGAPPFLKEWDFVWKCRRFPVDYPLGPLLIEAMREGFPLDSAHEN